MASNTVDVGNGATLTLGTDTWESTAEIISMEWSGITREAIETTHLATSVPADGALGSKTFIPSDHTDPGELTVEWHFNPDLKPPMEAAAETITVTWLGPDDAAGATWSASGFFTGYGTGTVGVEEKMVATATIKFTGTITITVDA